jgi:adenosylhomocysteine nucleosidase
LIQAISPLNLVICCGASGSLNPDVGVGDVVAATTTVEHDYTLRFVQRPDPRFPGDEKTISDLRNAFSTQPAPFRLHFNLIASGDEDVVTTERAMELGQQTNGVCVAWEGAGVARACRFNNVPFLELRAVTDLADKSAASDFDLNLAQAMRNAAWLLHRWLA